MQFYLKVKNSKTLNEWNEQYDIPNLKTELEIEQWCKDTIERYNNTLRPHESPREYLGYIAEGASIKLAPHNWDKDSLRMRSNFRGRFIDVMICRYCGVTGKRFGMNEFIKIDSKFKKKVFETCTEDTKKAVLLMRE